MKILFDHCVNWRLARLLSSHYVRSTSQMGWEKLENGALLAQAATQFDCVLTLDKNIRHQQNLATLPIAVVVLAAQSNAIADLIPLVPVIEEQLKNLSPRTVVEVSLPKP